MPKREGRLGLVPVRRIGLLRHATILQKTMSDPIQFFVPGIPKPGGSKKAFFRPGMRFPVVVEDCKKNKEWRAVVALAGHEAFPHAPLDGPLSVTYVFVMPRVKAHYRTGKRATELRDDAPIYHTVKPDCTKLVRSTEDALTGILWADDAQCAVQSARKEYGTTTGCFITVERIQSQTPWRHPDAHSDLFPKPTQNCLT